MTPEERIAKLTFPPVLDACCAGRAMWFDKKDHRALFMDIRKGTWVVDVGTPGTVGRSPIVVDPDIVADFTKMPFPDNTFHLVVFDPPHVKSMEMLGAVTRKYGVLLAGWEEVIRGGFEECFRVLIPNGVLIFKWCEVKIPLSDVLKLTPEKPLFGHRSGSKAKTHWVAFLKSNPP